MTLPKWKLSSHDHGNCELCDCIEKALAVAVEALEEINNWNDAGKYDCGLCGNYMDPKKHKDPCAVPVAENALAQIEKMGE